MFSYAGHNTRQSCYLCRGKRQRCPGYGLRGQSVDFGIRTIPLRPDDAFTWVLDGSIARQVPLQLPPGDVGIVMEGEAVILRQSRSVTSLLF